MNGFDPRLIRVGFMVNEMVFMVFVRIFLRKLRFFPVSIIPLALRIYSSVTDGT